MKVSGKRPFFANAEPRRLQSGQIFMRHLLILPLLVAGGLVSACLEKGGDARNAPTPAPPSAERQAEDPAKTANDSAEELAEFIELPFEPVEVEWREQPAASSGQSAYTGRKLVAVMRFSREHADRIAAEAGKLGPASPATIETEEWYPAELIAHSEMNGDAGLAATAYRADIFYRAPFSEGRVLRIDGTDYFVLELFAK